VSASPRARNLRENKTTQGLYTTTAQGKFIEFNNNRTPDRVKKLLQKTLEKFRSKKTRVSNHRGKRDKRFERTPPEGGLVLDVFSRILGNPYPPSKKFWDKVKAKSVGRDHLWITKKEVKALIPKSEKKYQLLKSLMIRIVRFHLVDNTRGEPPMWKIREIKSANITVTVEKKEIHLRIDGEFHLATSNNDRGYDAKLLGYITISDKKIKRFDMVVRGKFWGEGRYTKGAPKRKFTLAIVFTLAGNSAADMVPPQGSRDFHNYMGRR